ncbi:hypothetical protein CC79DRAFT_728219 [Sarocladium strictum]
MHLNCDPGTETVIRRSNAQKWLQRPKCTYGLGRYTANEEAEAGVGSGRSWGGCTSSDSGHPSKRCECRYERSRAVWGYLHCLQGPGRCGMFFGRSLDTVQYGVQARRYPSAGLWDIYQVSYDHLCLGSSSQAILGVGPSASLRRSAQMPAYWRHDDAGNCGEPTYANDRGRRSCREGCNRILQSTSLSLTPPPRFAAYLFAWTRYGGS